MHLQYCAVLSQQGEHSEALKHGKLGAKCIHMGIKELEKLIETLSMKLDATLLETNARKFLPILQVLISYLIPEEATNNAKTKREIRIKNLFGFIPCLESVMGLNMGNLMQLTPLSLVDILSEYDVQYEFTRESLLERIGLLVISYFCISTETRFSTTSLKEAEFFHVKALELACKFLPAECSLTTHIYMTYQKYYSPIHQVIVSYNVK